MNKKNKNRLIVIIGIVAAAFLVFLVFQLNKDQDSDTDSRSETTFKDSEMIVYLGEENAKSEVLFAFDYSCPWCTVWIDEVLPHIEKYIVAGEVKFRTQALGLLNPLSLKLAEVDQNLKVHYDAEIYYDVFLELIGDSTEIEITDDYLIELANKNGIDSKILLEEPDLDMTVLTNDYLEGLEIESVPTLSVNGKKLEDPFDLDAIEALLNQDK